MSFRGQTRVLSSWKWEDDTVTDIDSNSRVTQITEGSGSGEGSGSWKATEQVLTSGSSITYDLTALPRVLFGASITYAFSRVIAIHITSEEDSVGDLRIGGAASDVWELFVDDTDKIDLEPDNDFLLTNYASGRVVDSSNKNLKLEALSGDVTYTISIIGNVEVASGS